MRYKAISMFVSVILATLAPLAPPAGTAHAETAPQRMTLMNHGGAPPGFFFVLARRGKIG